jgi:hypothetical protein
MSFTVSRVSFTVPAMKLMGAVHSLRPSQRRPGSAAMSFTVSRVSFTVPAMKLMGAVRRLSSIET